MTGTRSISHALVGAGLALAVLGAGCQGGAKPTASPSAPATTNATAAGGTGPGSPTSGGGPGAGSCPTGTTTPGSPGRGDVLVPGDIPDGARPATYHSPDGYRVDHPEGWSQPQTTGGVSFTDKFNSIRVELSPAATKPTVASVRGGEAQALAGTVACFQLRDISQVARKADPATVLVRYRATYQSNSAQDPVSGKVIVTDVERYEFWRSGRQATITLSSPRGSDNVDAWREVTDSFAWEP